jgi:hypothetical protein
MLAVGQRADWQRELPAIVESGGIEIGTTLLRVETEGSLNLLPELMRLHQGSLAIRQRPTGAHE